MEDYSVLQREINFAIYNKMDGAGGHYAKLNKPDMEGQILPDTTFMMNL